MDVPTWMGPCKTCKPSPSPISSTFTLSSVSYQSCARLTAVPACSPTVHVLQMHTLSGHGTNIERGTAGGWDCKGRDIEREVAVMWWLLDL